MKRLALLGSKDFAEQIQILAEETGEYRVVGYFDDFEKRGTTIRNLPILGQINDTELLYREGAFDCVFFAAGYNNFSFRESAFEKLYGKVPFATIISSSAVIGKNVAIGEGVYIGANSYIDCNTVIGNNVFIHCGSTLGHNNIIKDHTYISGRFDTCGFVRIGKRCFVGVRCLVSDHITICDDTWLGIGSLILKDISQPGKYMTFNRLMRIE